MFTDKENLEDLTNDDLDKYLVEITADKSTLEACSNKLFDLVRRFIDRKDEVERKYKKLKQNINLESCKPTHDFNEDKLISTLIKIWEYIECNFDKKVEKIIVVGMDAQFYTSYRLDNEQNERLKCCFNIICDIESIRDFTLITLDI